MRDAVTVESTLARPATTARRSLEMAAMISVASRLAVTVESTSAKPVMTATERRVIPAPTPVSPPAAAMEF